MCLYIDHERTKRHSMLTINKEYTFYKQFIYGSCTVNNSNIFTPHQMWPVPLTTKFIQAKGDIEIQDAQKPYEIYGGVIHAFQGRIFGCKCRVCFRMTSFIVPITVYADDIVAFGTRDVCFFRFKFQPETIKYINEMRNKPDILKIYPNKTECYL